MRLEHWIYTIPLRLRSILFRRRVNQELDEEFQFHLEQQIASGVERGLPAAEAREQALRALDGIQIRKEECGDMRHVNFLENLLQDIRYALRVLRKSPAFTTVAILSLALGIGANTAIFSVMDVLLLRPLPVPQPDLLAVVNLHTKTVLRYSFNYPLFEMVRDRNQVFSETFAFSTQNLQTPVDGDMALIKAAWASGDYFSGLHVQPVIGRVFGREDDQPAGGNNGPVAVISEGLWSRKYGRKPTVLGTSIVVNGVALTIIGVMPAGFFGAEVGTAPEIWIPLNNQRQLNSPRCISSGDCWFLRVMGRLKPGISEQQAAAQLSAISHGIMEDSHPPERADRREEFLARTLSVEPGAAGFAGIRQRVRAPLRVLMALVCFVLLIACANMANLLTARAQARSREVAVRLAMGAAKARIVRQFLTESLIIAIAGASGGFLVAIASTRALIALLSTTDNPIFLDLVPDWRVLLFTAAAAIGTGFLFGLIPACRATRIGVAPALKERAHQIQTSGARFGFTRLLLGFQAALSIMLLAAAGLLASTLVRLWIQSPGFEPGGVTMVAIDTSKLPQKGEQLIDLYTRILEGARTLPNVDAATLLSTTPLTNSGWDNFVTVPGRPDLSEEQRDAFINATGPGLLETLRIPLLAGRAINEGDTSQSAKVAIISENAARLWFPKGAIGQNIQFQSTTVSIIGVAGNTKYSNLREQLPFTMYVPYTQWGQSGNIAVRTHAPLRQTYANFRDVLHRVAPGAPIRTIRTMEQQVSESLSTERLTAYLSVFFASLALLLTAIGLYGILAYSVTRRTSEIGIRMALGAQRGNVIWLVIREAMAHASAGAIVGIAAVVASAKLIASLLYGVQPHDPWTMVIAILVLALVCAIAAWVPARRASRLDPMVALREE